MSEVISLEEYRRHKEQCKHQCKGCRECANLVQYQPASYICGALENIETGESFFVIRNGEETVDYNNCEGASFVPKPQPLRPTLKRKAGNK